MPIHAEKKILPYTAEQIFNLVADVEKYPEFLPWVSQARIINNKENNFVAELDIGYKALTSSYCSQVVLHPHSRIDINYINGPFRYLNNHWQFTPLNEKLTTIDFYIDFEFQSSYLQLLMQSVFSEAVKRMIGSFEKRAASLYG